jgi:phospholipid-binding lipoprotein MlaA
MRNTHFLKLSALLFTALLAGCGTNPKDPLEPFNRASFAVNRVADKVVRPVAEAYVQVTPAPIRTGVSNFFSNMSDLTSSVNCLLQIKVQCAGENFLRFSFNSVFGFVGVLDVAGELGIPRTREDFGQTLGSYGVPAGPYIMLPVAGPATVRDLLAGRYGPDHYTDPLREWDSKNGRRVLGAVASLNGRAGALKAGAMLDDIALDPYAFLRDAHLQRRRNAVYDGNPPEEKDDLPPASDKPKATSQTSPDTQLVTDWGAVQTEASMAAKASTSASTPASTPAFSPEQIVKK